MASNHPIKLNKIVATLNTSCARFLHTPRTTRDPLILYLSKHECVEFHAKVPHLNSAIPLSA